MVRNTEELTEEEKRALRGSKFAPLPSLPASSSSRPQPRSAHPGGPLTTNKAAALAKFLERKLKDPDGLSTINPDLLELAVKNAKDTVLTSSSSNSGRMIRHVTSFGDTEESFEEVKESKKKKKTKKKKKNKKQKAGFLSMLVYAVLLLFVLIATVVQRHVFFFPLQVVEG